MAELDPLLERDSERAILADAIGDVLTGTGRFLVIEGPAGIGKSGLLNGVRALATLEHGMHVCVARGSELELDFAFGIVRQLLERMVSDPTLGDNLFTGAAAQAREIFAQSESASGASFALLHGLYWLTADLCDMKPTVFLIDDVQHCDVPSLRFLAHLLPRIAELPLLVLATLRTGEVGGQRELLDRVLTDPVVRVLSLAPLSPVGSQQLVRSELPDADDAFCRACHEAAAGNPLLLHELVRLARTRHIAPTMSGMAEIRALAPRVVRTRVREQLRRIGEAGVAVASALAVLESGESGVVAEVAGLSWNETLNVIDELVRHALLQYGDGRLHFVHPLVREQLYEAMSARERAAMHRRAAQCLLNRTADVEQVAAHLISARSPRLLEGDDAAVLRQAAAQASQRGAPHSALAYLSHLLESPAVADQRFAVLVMAAGVAGQVDPRVALKYLREAAALATRPAERLRIADAIGTTLLYGGEAAAATAVRTEALRLPLDDDPDTTDALLQIKGNLGITLTWSPSYREDRRQLAHELAGTPLATGAGARAVNAFLAQEAWIESKDPSEALRRANAVFDDPAVFENPNVVEPWVNAGVALLTFDPAAAMPIFQRCFEQAHVNGSILAGTMAAYLRSRAYHACGRLEDARQDLELALEATSAGSLQGVSDLLADAATCLIDLGELERAAEIIEPNVRDTDAAPSSGLWCIGLAALGQLRLAQGRLTDAIAVLEEAAAQWRAVGVVFTNHWPVLPSLAMAYLQAGRTESAAQLATENLRLARTWGAVGPLGRALRVAGLMARDKPEAQRQLFTESVAVLTDSYARLELASALQALGAAEISADRQRAANHLFEAMYIANTCAAVNLVQQAQAGLRRLGLRPRRVAAEGTDALTASERRVADLAANGASNRQIAQALFITTKTVETQLSSVYRKLGISGRSELAPALRPTG